MQNATFKGMQKHTVVLPLKVEVMPLPFVVDGGKRQLSVGLIGIIVHPGREKVAKMVGSTVTE